MILSISVFCLVNKQFAQNIYRMLDKKKSPWMKPRKSFSKKITFSHVYIWTLCIILGLLLFFLYN